jgi:hypothetical protein
LKKVNGTTVHSTLKFGGKPVGRSVRSLSGHGKVLTLTTDVTTPKGKIHQVAVFDKQ